jgi:uncharacterized protein YdaU (DUF1376 family)
MYHDETPVNFYKHHLGDYDGATAHLSWDEDQAYTRLLRLYYRLERPIPKSPAETFRLARAATTKQKEAITRVLHEFFEEREDGWHNKRADEEITAYKSQADTNRRIARERTVQRTVNDSLTKGVPNHKPLTKNHKPEEAKEQVGESAEALTPGGPVNGNAVCYIPLNDGTEFGVPKAMAIELERLYPAVDIAQTLNEIRGYNLAHPTRRKTARGIFAHINTWMAKEQNRGAKA